MIMILSATGDPRFPKEMEKGKDFQMGEKRERFPNGREKI